MLDEYRESNESENGSKFRGIDVTRGLAVAVLVLVAIAGLAFAYGYRQQSKVHELTAQASASSVQMTTLQGQVDALTAKLNGLTAAQNTPLPAAGSTTLAPIEPATPAPAGVPEAASAAPAPAKPAVAHAKHPAATKKHAPVDTKYTKLQAQLDEQQKELKDTQAAVEKNRADLEGSISATRDDLNSTRDDLNGSIARTHDELVVLEKRGERSYVEFDLSKSKQFQRVGPVTLSLRKADTKHKSYDLAMIVDDNELNKKKVNLYEPVWIHTENEAQPVQIVVNRIGKDSVHGYVSAPKYKPSELASAASAGVTPVSNKTSASTPNSGDQQQQPKQPEQ